jgi:hypothetical protein
MPRIGGLFIGLDNSQAIKKPTCEQVGFFKALASITCG